MNTLRECFSDNPWTAFCARVTVILGTSALVLALLALVEVVSRVAP